MTRVAIGVHTDWRGVPITAGALVIHSGTIGHATSISEARVSDDPFTKAGKVRLTLIRRAGGGAWRHAVGGLTVDPQNLTVVTQLPATDAATVDDLRRALHESINRRSL